MRLLHLLLTYAVIVLFFFNSKAYNSCENPKLAEIGTNYADSAPMWFVFTSETDTLVTISSCECSVDTDLKIFMDCNGTTLLKNDDNNECLSNELSSRVEWIAEAGKTYRIFWDNTWATNGFNWELTVGSIPRSPVITSIEARLKNYIKGKVEITFDEIPQVADFENKKNTFIGTESYITKYLDKDRPFIKYNKQASKNFVADGFEEVEPNDGSLNGSVSQQIELGSIEEPTKITGHFGASLDYWDEFEFNLADPSYLFASLEVEAGQAYLWIVNDSYSGVRIAVDNSEIGSVKFSEDLLPNGNYHVIVQPLESTEDPGFAYNLKVWSASPPTFMIYRNDVAIDSAPMDFKYVDNDIQPGIQYCFQVSQVLNDGTLSDKSTAKCITPVFKGGEMCFNALDVQEGVYDVDDIPVWYKYTATTFDTLHISSENADADTYLVIYDNCGIGDPGNIDSHDYLFYTDDIDSNSEDYASCLEFLTEPGKEYFIYWGNEWSSSAFQFSLETTSIAEGDIIENPIQLSSKDTTISSSFSGYNDNYLSVNGIQTFGKDIVYELTVDKYSSLECVISADEVDFVLYDVNDETNIINGSVVSSYSFSDIYLKPGDYIFVIALNHSAVDENFELDFDFEEIEKINVSINVDLSNIDGFNSDERVYLKSSSQFGEQNNLTQSIEMTDGNNDMIYSCDTLLFPGTFFNYQYYSSDNNYSTEWENKYPRSIELGFSDTVINDSWGVKHFGTDILAFSVLEQIHPTVISYNNHTVDVLIKSSADITNIKPYINVSDSAEINPGSEVNQNFTNQITYNVSSFNGTDQDWQVNIEKASYDTIVYWHEDFSDPDWSTTVSTDNLYNGNQLPNDFTFFDNTNRDFYWHWSLEGPRGAYTEGDDDDPFTPNQSIVEMLLDYSSVENGFLMLESDYFCTGEDGEISVSYDMDSYVQVGPIDLSDARHPCFLLNQLFILCCSHNRETVIEISTDYDPENPGKETWIKKSLQLVTSLNSYTHLSERSFQLDISEECAGKSNVYFRVCQRNSSHYFWIIDDLKVIENPIVHELAIDHQEIGWMSQNNLTMIPSFFGPTLQNVKTVIENKGINTQSNIFIDFKLSKNNSEVFNARTYETDIMANSLFCFDNDLNIGLFQTGEYILESEIQSTIPEAITENNKITQKLIVTDSTLSYANNLDSYNGYNNYAYKIVEENKFCGQLFKIPDHQIVNLTSVSFLCRGFDNYASFKPIVEAEDYYVTAKLFKQQSGEAVYTGVSSQEHLITSEECGAWITLPFKESYYTGGDCFVALDFYCKNNTGDVIEGVELDAFTGNGFNVNLGTKALYQVNTNRVINLHLHSCSDSVFSIKDIQQPLKGTDVSKFEGSDLRTKGIVFAKDSDGFYLQDNSGEWSSIYIESEETVAINDLVQIKGMVYERNGVTIISDVTEMLIISHGNEAYDAEVATIDKLSEEAFESILVKVDYLECASIDTIEGYAEYTNGINTLIVSNTLYYFVPIVGNKYSFTGVVDQSNGSVQLLPRMQTDIYAYSPANTITSFNIPDVLQSVTIDSLNFIVNGVLKYNTDESSLIPEIEVSKYASIYPGSGVAQNFSDTVFYEVEAEDMSIANWAVVLTVGKPLSNKNDILSFHLDEIIDSALIDTVNKTITATLFSTSNIYALSPVIEISEKATITPESGDTLDFSNPVTYIVSAEDSTKSEWLVTLNRKLSADATLKSIKINNHIIDEFKPDSLEYEVQLISIDSLPDIVVESNHDSARVSFNKISSVFDTLNIVVTAEDNITKQNYKVYLNLHDTVSNVKLLISGDDLAPISDVKISVDSLELLSNKKGFVLMHLNPGIYQCVVDKEDYESYSFGFRVAKVLFEKEIVLSRITGVDLKSDKSSAFKIYPNPSSGELYIEIDKGYMNSQILIYNMLGELIFTETIKSLNSKLDLNHLLKGTYIVKVISEFNTLNKQIIIQ